MEWREPAFSSDELPQGDAVLCRRTLLCWIRSKYQVDRKIKWFLGGTLLKGVNKCGTVFLKRSSFIQGLYRAFKSKGYVIVQSK